MFFWPCYSIHLCKENQLDAIFTLSLFRQSTSTCFGHICSPSSGSILYIYNNRCVLCFSVECLMEFHPNPANRQSTEKHNTYHLLYMYSIPPDNGLRICPKHVEVDWPNKLRINSALSWILLHRSSNIFAHNKGFRANLQWQLFYFTNFWPCLSISLSLYSIYYFILILRIIRYMFQ